METKLLQKLITTLGLRWWLTPSRTRAAVPVRLKIQVANYAKRVDSTLSREYYALTFDVSESGVFIPFEQPPTSPRSLATRRQTPDAAFREVAPKVQCYLCLHLGGLDQIQCLAEITRNSHAQGAYPAGVGIRLLGLSRNESRRLVEYAATLPGERARFHGSPSNVLAKT